MRTTFEIFEGGWTRVTVESYAWTFIGFLREGESHLTDDGSLICRGKRTFGIYTGIDEIITK